MPPIPAELEDPLRRDLGRLARIVSAMTITAMAAMLAGFGYLLIHPRMAAELANLPGIAADAAADDNALRIRLFLALLPSTLLFVAAAHQIRALFLRFGRGHILDQANGGRLARLGWILIAGAAVAVLTRSFVALALTLDNAPGRRHLLISFSFNDLVMVLFGLVVLAFAKVVLEASRVADENRGFI